MKLVKHVYDNNHHFLMRGRSGRSGIMAYGGRCDVTKQVAIYVKEHYYLSNQKLDRNIQKIYVGEHVDKERKTDESNLYNRRYAQRNGIRKT